MHHEKEKQLQHLLLGMTRTELVETSKMVKEHYGLLLRQETQSFLLGDKVSFVSSRTGQTVRGVVTKRNQKTITVLASNGTNWRVPSTLLKKDTGVAA